VAFSRSLGIVALLLRPIAPVLKNFAVVNEVFVVTYPISLLWCSVCMPFPSCQVVFSIKVVHFLVCTVSLLCSANGGKEKCI
jgi:hypothetical protein